MVMMNHVQLFPHPVYFRVQKEHLALFHAAVLFPRLWVTTFSFDPLQNPNTFIISHLIISHHPPGLAPQLTGADLYLWFYCCFFFNVPPDMSLLTLSFFPMILPQTLPWLSFHSHLLRDSFPGHPVVSQKPLELASPVVVFPHALFPGLFLTQHTYYLICLHIVCIPS